MSMTKTNIVYNVNRVLDKKGNIMRKLSIGFLSTILLAQGAVAAEDLFKMAQAEQPAFIETWKSLVNIDSGSGYAPGLAAVENQLTQKLESLGAKVETFPVTTGVGNSIVGTFSGKGTQQILLMIHYDTVFNEGEAEKRAFRTDATKAYGPGVADAKGGAAMILHTVKLLNDLKFSNYKTLTVFFNPDEELGSPGSSALIKKLAAEQDYVFSFEPPNQDAVLVGVKGITNIDLHINGVAAHAGAAPEQGRNAVIEMAHQLLQLNDLGDANKGTTVNWTIAQGGDKKNVIPDKAYAIADMRIWDIAEVERVQKQAEDIIKKHLVPDTEVTISMNERRPPLTPNSDNKKLAEQAQQIYRDLNRELTVTSIGFGSDAGFAYNPKNSKPIVLEGLGVVGGNLHSPDEYAELESIAARLYLTARMIQETPGE